MPGRLLILGGAACVWDDVERLGAAKPGRSNVVKFDGDIMCVNMAGLFVETFQHWYSNDGKWLLRLHAARRPEWAKMYPGPIRLHSCMPCGGVEHWDWNAQGSSGLNAVKVGLALGYGEIILCGIPLDDGPHVGDPPWKACNFTREVAAQVDSDENRFWKSARLTEFGGRVKSMSGRTREWLGGIS